MAQTSCFFLTPEATCAFDPNDLVLYIDRKVSLPLAPISEFYVGAVGIGLSGVVYLGINVELPGLLLHHSIDAVQFLVANLALQSEGHLTHLAVSANDSDFDAPYGNCCEFIKEICETPFILIKDSTKNINEYVSLKNPLPHPETLAPGRRPFFLQSRDNKLTLLHPEGEILEDPDLETMALGAANKAFAPYTNCPSGVDLKNRDGKVYRRWYMESAVYNPSLGPVQVALVDLVIRGGRTIKFDNIVEAVMVEKKDVMVS